MKGVWPKAIIRSKQREYKQPYYMIKTIQQKKYNQAYCEIMINAI